VVTNFNQAIDEGADRASALKTAMTNSLRPVVMTCLSPRSACCRRRSTGIGSQVQKPLALVVVGGMTLAPVLILLVLPLLIDRFSSRPAQWAKRPREKATKAKKERRCWHDASLMNAALRAALLIATATPALAAPVKVDLPQRPHRRATRPPVCWTRRSRARAGTAQAVHPGAAVEGEWWKAFGPGSRRPCRAGACRQQRHPGRAGHAQAGKRADPRGAGRPAPDRRGLPGLAPARWQRAVVTPLTQTPSLFTLAPRRST
jgi:hypothetical protein